MGYSRNQTFITVQDIGLNAASIFSEQRTAAAWRGGRAPRIFKIPVCRPSASAVACAPLAALPTCRRARSTNTTEIFDNVSWVAPFGKSKHSFRVGYHIRREQARRYLDSTERGSFSFLSWADFAAGLVNTSTFKTGNTLAYWDRFPWDVYCRISTSSRTT